MNMRLVAVAVVVSSIAAGAWYFGLNNTIKQQSAVNNVLIIGTAAGYAPFASINEQGVFEGFDIDVANALADKLGKNIVLQDFGSMTALMLALDQGKIDAIIWGVTITDARLKKYAMVHYYGETIDTYPLVFWNSIPAGVTTLDDMAGLTVCVEPSSSQYAVIEQYPQITVLPVDKVDDALLNIQYGKADAALLESAIAYKFKNKCPQIHILDVPLAPHDREQGVGIVMRRNDAALIKQVTDVIAVLKSDKTIQDYATRWGIA